MASLRSAAILISGNGAGFVVRFVRNVLLARLLTVENYGIASTFIVALSLVSMATDLDFSKLMLQNRRGADPDFIAAVKSMQILRGVFMAIVMFALGAPMARLFDQPELAWAYQIMALPPLIWSFRHPDLTRYARSLNFRPQVVNNVVSGIVAVLLIWPLVQIFGDYRVVLALFVLEGLVQLALSFAQAERPYRLAWDGKIARLAVKFGWPIMMSGLLVFAILQGDRIIVANQYGARELGYFSAALNLVMPAVLASAQLVRSFFLPLLSRFQDAGGDFDHRAIFSLQSSLCATQLAILGFAFAGPPVLVAVYGSDYAPAVPMIGLIGVSISFQLARAGSSTVAMARGNTVNMLIANLVRIAFLPGALLIAVQGGSVIHMLLVGAVGQVVAYGVSLALLYLRSGLGRGRAMAGPVLAGTASLACLMADLLREPGGMASLSVLSVLATLFFLLQIALCRTMLGELRRLVQARRRR